MQEDDRPELQTVSSGETSDLPSNHFFDNVLVDHCTGEGERYR